MADWKTDAELHEIADRLAKKIFEMYTKAAGTYIGGIGAGSPRVVFTDSLRQDAEEFTALDPQKVADEFQRMKRVATDVGENGEARAKVDVALARLSVIWRGSAAEKFAAQMSHIRTFMDQQQSRTMLAMQAMSTTFALAVHMRRSYYNLAEAAIAACDNEIDKQKTRDTKAWIGMGSEIVKAGIGLTNPGNFAAWAADSLVSISAKGAEIALEGNEAEEVAANYTLQRSQLRSSFDEGLHELRKWLTKHDGDLGQDRIPLLEPLPMNAHVDSPDFRYEHFSSEHRDPTVFGAKVEEQRRKDAEDKRVAEGLVARRLGGAR